MYYSIGRYSGVAEAGGGGGGGGGGGNKRFHGYEFHIIAKSKSASLRQHRGTILRLM